MGWLSTLGAVAGGAPGYLIGREKEKADRGEDSLLFGDAKVGLDPARAQLEGAQYQRDIAQQRIGDIMGGRQAPQADRTMVGPVARADETRADQFRQGQLSMASRLSDIATGQRAGAGELAARRMGERGMAQQFALGASARGGNAALAARQAARGAADVSAQAAGQAQEAALRDQQLANQQLGQVLGQGRGQDLQVSLANMGAENQRIFQQAGLDQSTSLANMQARLQMIGMNDQAILGYLSQLLGVDAAELNARMQQDQLAIAQRRPGMLGDLVAAGGQMGAAYAASDIRAKQNIRPGDVSIREFLGSLAPHTYEYKDPGKHGVGERTSVMAQELEQSPLGRAFVDEKGGVKHVDYGKGLGTMLASIASLHHRVEGLEGKR